MALRLTFPQVSGYFANSATHSTCMVIGKTPMLLSVNAILCRQVRSSEEGSR